MPTAEALYDQIRQTHRTLSSPGNKPPAEQSSSQPHGMHADASSVKCFGNRPAPSNMPTPRMPAAWGPQHSLGFAQEGPELSLVPSSELAGPAAADTHTNKAGSPMRSYQEPLSTRPLSSTAESIMASPGQDLYDLLAGDSMRAQQGGPAGKQTAASQDEQASMFGTEAFSYSDSEPLTHKEDPYASSNLPSLYSPYTQRADSPDHLAAFCAEHYK